MAKAYDYNLTLTRTDQEGEQLILLDKDITADEAIEMMLANQGKEEEVDEFKDYTLVHHEPETKNKPAPGKKGKVVDYDKEAVKADIKAGKLSTKDIAYTHGITDGMVYQIKSQMKKAGELDGDKPKVQSVTSNEDRVKNMVRDGDSDAEIYAVMHDFMTDAEFRVAIDKARNSI